MKNNKKGFTLAELLIVVAIIAVLTAVAVPIFTTQLEKSREQTDIANLREAKAAAVAAYLGEESINNVKFGPAGADTQEAYWDAGAGKLGAKPTTGYGKGTAADGKCDPYDCGGTNNKYTATGSNVAGQVIKVTVTKATGDVVLSWDTVGGGNPNPPEGG